MSYDESWYIRVYIYNILFLHVVNSEPQIKRIQDLLIQETAPHWRSIGIELLSNDDVTKITTITQNYPTDHERCCSEMFGYWLRTDKQATWQKLLDALESKAVGLNALADKVKKSMCKVAS